MAPRPTEIIAFEEGWSYIHQKGVAKLIRIIDNEPEPPFTTDQIMELHTYVGHLIIVYHMYNQQPDYPQQLYDKCRQVIEDYIIQTVLLSLREKHGEDMLRELVMRWKNHKTLVKKLRMFFCYMESRFIPSLSEVGLTRFRDLVYGEMQSTATEVVLALIDREVVETVLEVYVENGMGTKERYEEDFERVMLQETVSYYSPKASMWMKEYSSSDYLLKCDECLKREQERVIHYFYLTTEPKLVEALQEALKIFYV
ncbi:hypothetical protein CARUB_v10022176mg [Capsella rubella]|uniref:Cullin N-terminal domain-containing protein n=1 Tax=Capsella rubella TaxID=81985 RepID=R0GG29_9BRAS|nr:hypothetical protein CARUB_v10022176mg [Capsella rubella]